MSGIIGILNLDGRAVDQENLWRMTNAIAHRGADDAGHWLDGPIGLGQRMFHTTPESTFDTYPLANETNQIFLTVDGRVDNRLELKKALTAKGFTLRNEGDGELFLRAYECWGEACVYHILGDWAFIIWDASKQLLVMARDAIGIRPLLYWLTNDRLLLASEPSAIFAHSAPRREVNWAVLGDYLSNNWTEHEETLDAGVKRLPAGHIATVKDGQFKMRRYWPDNRPAQIRYKHQEAYAEHFLTLFEDAIRSQTRAINPVGILLSGGLDSSSITCVAQDMLRNNRGGNVALETLSVVYPGLECDESAYINAVTETIDISVNHVAYSSISDGSPLLSRAQEFPDLLYSPSVMGPILLYTQRAHERGMHVLIDGIGGDELFSGRYTWHLADMLRQGNFATLIRRLQTARLWTGMSTKQLLVQHTLWPLLPNQAKQIGRQLRQQITPPEKSEIGSWINPDFAAKWDIQKRFDHRWEKAHNPAHSIAKQFLYDLFTASYNVVHALEFNDRVMARLSLEKRHPFLSRRLLDFCLAIPEDVRFDDEISKLLLRQATQKVLPEKILKRENKVMFDSIWDQQINTNQAAAIDNLFENLQLEANGVLKAHEAQRLLADFRQGNTGAATPVDLILSLELWHRYSHKPEVLFA